jgi:hypothetical protein
MSKDQQSQSAGTYQHQTVASGRWLWSNSGANPPSNVTVWDDPNPEVGRLLGPNGQVAKIVRAKPDHPIGFRP